jgi:hypothetical protein
MKLPAESLSSWSHVGFASFTWASLKAWSEFTELSASERAELAKMAASVRGAMDALVKEARETQDAQIFGRPEAQAKQNAWLLLLKRVTAEALSTVTMKLGHGSKDHPKVREFLPDLLTGITKKGVADRPQAVKEAAGRLAGLQGELDEKAKLVERLEKAATSAQEAVNANDGASSAWSKERSEEIVAKGRLRLELERAHRQLGATFPGQRDFVESFFLRGARPSEGATEPEETGDSGAPAKPEVE